MAANEIAGKRQSDIAGTRRVEEIVALTGLPVASRDDLQTTDFYLYWRDQQLTLRDQSTKNPLDISIDFGSGKYQHRRQFGGGYGQPLARAVEAKPGHTPLVCDATGGLGQDAFVFASLGCNVVILERSRIIFALLHDALQRAMSDHHVREIAEKMTVHHLDSRDLPGCWPAGNRPAIVYLDPMYPHNNKSAAAKKGMQTLQRLLALEQPDQGKAADKMQTASDSVQTDEESLLFSALRTATRRVAVKRPLKAPALSGATPVGSIKSTNTRYDLYNARD